jgi:hypothetical protein
MTTVKDHTAREIQGAEFGVARVRVTHEDLTDTDTSQTFTWAALVAAHPTGASSVPANAFLVQAGITRITDFAGGSISAITAKLGDSGNDDELLEAASTDIFTGAKATKTIDEKNGTYTLWSVLETGYSPTVTIDSTSDNVDQATAGECELWIVYCAITTDPRVKD